MSIETHDFRQSTEVERFSAGGFLILADSPQTKLWVPVILKKDGLEFHTTVDRETGELRGGEVQIAENPDGLDEETVRGIAVNIQQALLSALNINPTETTATSEQDKELDRSELGVETKESFQTPRYIAEAEHLAAQRHDELLD